MNYRIFTLLLSIFFLNVLTFSHVSTAQDEAAVADPIEFGKAKFSYYTVAGKKWIKGVVQMRCKGDPDAKTAGTDPAWLKDVDVSLTCAFEGQKKEMVWFSSAVKLYALERNNDYFLSFYIPSEIVAMNSFKADPVAYMIEMSANGKSYPLHAKNYTKRSNLTAANVKSFMDAASANSASNQGVMVYYDDAPFIVKYNDVAGAKQPTSKPKR